MTPKNLRSHAERVRRIIFAACAAAGLLALVTGCSNGCATDSAPYPPALTVDASSWFASNPDSTVQVCLNSVCSTVGASQASAAKGLVKIGQGASKSGEDAAVKVLVSRGTQVLVRSSRTVKMKQNQCISMPCGCLPQGSSTSPLRLGSDGNLSSG